MQRPINFRAWDKDKKQMRYVTAINWYDEYLWVDETPMSGDKLPIESTPVMQSTGLKDKNGKEIYEGDLFTIDGKGLYEVVFEIGCFSGKPHRLWQPRASRYAEILAHLPTSIEVIGNIYENADLLK